MSTVGAIPTPQPPPPDIFAGKNRIYAATWYSILSLFSITLHTTFIAAARKLCGWESNASFTFLLFLSSVAMLKFVVHLTASLTALLYLDWVKYQWLWIFLGSLTTAPYLTIVLLNFVIALHRLLYTAFPLSARYFMSKTVIKIIVIFIGVVFILLVVVFNTQLIGVRWIDAFMSFVAMTSRNALAFYIINKVSNYLVGVVNFAAYALLLFILVKKRMLSLSRNHEIKLTLQVLCMMVGEVLFFLFWELWDMEGTDALYFLLAETSILLFYDVLILPYLIFNGKVHAEIKRMSRLYRNGGSLASRNGHSKLATTIVSRVNTVEVRPRSDPGRTLSTERHEYE